MFYVRPKLKLEAMQIEKRMSCLHEIYKFMELDFKSDNEGMGVDPNDSYKIIVKTFDEFVSAKIGDWIIKPFSYNKTLGRWYFIVNSDEEFNKNYEILNQDEVFESVSPCEYVESLNKNE